METKHVDDDVSNIIDNDTDAKSVKKEYEEKTNPIDNNLDETLVAEKEENDAPYCADNNADGQSEGSKCDDINAENDTGVAPSVVEQSLNNNAETQSTEEKLGDMPADKTPPSQPFR